VYLLNKNRRFGRFYLSLPVRTLVPYPSENPACNDLFMFWGSQNPLKRRFLVKHTLEPKIDDASFVLLLEDDNEWMLHNVIILVQSRIDFIKQIITTVKSIEHVYFFSFFPDFVNLVLLTV